MTLARSISEATQKERDDLAAFLAAEFGMQSLDVTEKTMIELDPADVAKAIAAWAFMQLNERDGEA